MTHRQSLNLGKNCDTPLRIIQMTECLSHLMLQWCPNLRSILTRHENTVGTLYFRLS